MNVLHITAHMGGGVGKFLSATIKNEKNFQCRYIHRIRLLENPQNSYFVRLCMESGVSTEVISGDLYSDIKWSDIVILHWWHHPVMAGFLNDFPQIPMRLIIWSHVSGCNYPNIPYELAILPHKMFFTSAYSLENPLWSLEQVEQLEEKSSIVYGLGIDTDNIPYRPVKLRRDDGIFKIGYVGTLSNNKIHPMFIDFCVAVLNNIPNARFFLAGDSSECNAMRHQAALYGVIDKINFLGYIKDVNEFLETMDVFGYPLNPYHFGTTENSVIEAMASGLPVVMLNQCTEKYILNNRYDGILVNNIEEYAAQMVFLCENKEERIRLGKNAINTVRTKFSLRENIGKMHGGFCDVAAAQKKVFYFRDVLGNEPYQWFLSCLGRERDAFYKSTQCKDPVAVYKIKNCSAILKGNNKSSIRHFARTYSSDAYLNYWLELTDSLG